jgi:DNA-directed RNA polymerase subunit RPC12/RpoP
VCQHEHKWSAIIAHRAKPNGSGCPYCSGRRAITGVNDLQTLFPQLAKEWHSQKNDEFTPDTISAFSGKKVSWICEKGHEWSATVINRSKRKSNCPYCSGRKAILGETDLGTINPNWHQSGILHKMES